VIQRKSFGDDPPIVWVRKGRPVLIMVYESGIPHLLQNLESALNLFPQLRQNTKLFSGGFAGCFTGIATVPP
jgi:hypothetical protein